MTFHLPLRRWPRRVGLLAAIALLVSACGSGNDDSAAPATAQTRLAGLISIPGITDSALVLPLEVLGNGSPATPKIAEAKLSLPSGSASTVAQLWFQCHRCGFYGAPEFEATTRLPTKVKASVRVLGSAASSTSETKVPWIDITDATVTLADDERLHGGINGGLYTTRMTLTLDAATRARLVALPRTNLVQFRFNGTDGESNGFRILDLQLRDANAARVDTTTVRQADPLAERTTTASSSDIAAGKALWYAQGRIAKSSIVTRKLQAACASCHADNASDLQYFNYSNNAIVQRGLFHGLSETQGRQIAAFVRSSLKSMPYAANARPWNPPYQPGPGLDANPAGWAGGAGLQAVLATPAQGVNALFGKPVDGSAAITQADVDRVMDPNATLNAREMPVPLQFPDWNAWLPTIHPLDVWPTQANGTGFANGAQFDNGNVKNPNGYYKSLLAWLDTHRNPNGKAGDWSHLTPDERTQIMAMFTQSGWEGYSFIGGGRGNHIGSGVPMGAQVGAARLQALASSATVAAGKAGAFTTNAFIERAVASMLHWNTIKQWEIVQQYQLEGNQTWFIGEKDATSGAWKGRGEAHGWPFNSVSLFFLAPHMVYQEDKDTSGRITREWYTAWEADNITASYYRSNQWYQLQMTVNPGGQSGWVNFPMDWPYLTAFDDYLGQRVGDREPIARAAQQTHYLRLLQARIKSAQYVNNDITIWDPSRPPPATSLFDNPARYGRAQVVKHLGVANFLDNASRDGVGRSKYAFLDDVQPGLYLKMVNGAVNQFTALYAAYPAAAWRRCDPSNTSLGDPEDVSGFRYCLDQARKPLGTYADGTHFMNSNAYYQVTTEQAEQYGLWQAARIGVEPTRLQVWKDWADKVWQ